MRYLLIVLLLSGCNANKLLRMAIDKGAKVTTETKIERDTIEINTVRDSLVYEKQVDTVKLKANCDSLIRGSKSAVKAIQKEVCPDIQEVITLSIPVTVNDSTYRIDVILSLEANGGALSAKLHNEPAEILYTETTSNSTTIEAPAKGFKWWHLVIAVLVGLGVGVLVKR